MSVSTNRIIIVMAVFVLLFVSCNFFDRHEQLDEQGKEIKKNWREAEALKNVDMEFSAYSRDSGMKKAYYEFLDEDGVVLRPQNYPLEGAAALDFLSQIDDSKIEVTWAVQGADVAKSGELGYTYGIFFVTDKESKDTIENGTYNMIWRKQKSGSWKVVMDSGNPGLGEKKNSVETAPDSIQ